MIVIQSSNSNARLVYAAFTSMKLAATSRNSTCASWPA